MIPRYVRFRSAFEKRIMNKLLYPALAGACLFPCSGTAQKPNVILILVDDMGWNDLGCTGSPFYETPNIDRLASQGALFTSGYAPCQVSSPSRASILTGKTPARHGITNWIGERSGEEWRAMGRHSKLLPAEYAHVLSQDEVTLPKKLKQNGYVTFMAGKWHVGGEGSTPADHGFDINIGGFEAGSPPGGYFVPYKNPKLEDGPAGEELTMRLAEETASFIAGHIENDPGTPFFAYLSFYAVHGPVQTTEERWAYYRNKADGQGIHERGFEVDRTLPVRQYQDNPVYAGLVAQTDDAVGHVMSEIERLGVAGNTIVIFTSDNGGVSSGDDFSTSCLPLRGGKGRQWEGGLRVPLIIKYPGCDTPQVFGEPAIGMDLYPTVIDMAGIEPVPGQYCDGVSLKPLLDGGAIPERDLFWHYPHYGNQGGEPSSVIRSGDWKLIRYYEDGRDELYNLAVDGSESETLNAQYPEKVAELSGKLGEWLDGVGARYPEPDPLYDPVKEAEYKKRQRTVLLERLERSRLEQLTEGWRPNDDWWGSKVTID